MAHGPRGPARPPWPEGEPGAFGPPEPAWPPLANNATNYWPMDSPFGTVVLIGGPDPRAGKPENPTLQHLGR